MQQPLQDKTLFKTLLPEMERNSEESLETKPEEEHFEDVGIFSLF